VRSGSVTTLAGLTGNTGFADGRGSAARFSLLQGVAIDGAGNAYVADHMNCAIREVSTEGVVTTLAGRPPGGYADGRGSAAALFLPSGPTVDASGNIYVADVKNNAIRRVTADGDVTTYAGTPDRDVGDRDGPGSSALFSYVMAAAADRAGNVYVADPINSAVRKIDTARNVTTFARLTATYLAVDAAGLVYASDGGNNVISRISQAGDVTTIAGQPGQYGSTDGSAAGARFRSPQGIAVDATGNLYVADTGNSTIRKITPDGTVSTIAGTPGRGKIVLGTSPGLSQPTGLAITGASLVITDGFGVLLLRHAVR
jgi:sugar lactone lactonase YvrE